MAKTAEQTDGRPPLSTDAIVDAATILIERDGLRAFTMRSLGRELGVSAMAVYSHFASRDEVLAAVLNRFMGTMDTDPIPGERWDDTLRRTMTSIYREELAHPEIASIEVHSAAAAQGLAAHTDKIVSLHLAQGMPEPILKQAWAIVDAFLTGFAGKAIALKREDGSVGAPVPASASSESDGSTTTSPWQSIVSNAYTDEAFTHGVEIIIQGIRALAAPDPCEWYTPES